MSVWRRLGAAVAAVGLLVSVLTVAQVASRVGVSPARAATGGFTAPTIAWTYHIDTAGYQSPPAGNWFGYPDSITNSATTTADLVVGIQCDDGYVNELRVEGNDNGFFTVGPGQGLSERLCKWRGLMVPA